MESGLRLGSRGATAIRRSHGVTQLDMNLLVECPGEICDRSKRKLPLTAEIAVQLLSANADELRELLLRDAILRPPCNDGGDEVATNIGNKAASRTRTRANLKPK